MVINRTNMSTIISHKLVHLRQQSRHSASSSPQPPPSCSGSMTLHAAQRRLHRCRRLLETVQVSCSSSISSCRRSITRLKMKMMMMMRRSVLAADYIDNAHWLVRKMSFSLSSSSEIGGTGNMGCEQLR